MKKFIWLGVVTVSILLLSGCSSKKYFEPAKTHKATQAISGHKGKAVYLTRDGVTFNNQTYINRKSPGSALLGKGNLYIGEDSTYIMVSNIEGKLSLISKRSKKLVKSIDLQVPVVSAAIKGGKIVYLLQDNTFGIYKISNGEKIIESKSDDTSAVDARIANPLFVDNLAVIPTLDGKILIVDINNPENAKVIYVSSKANLNNIIYLSRMGNLLITATPSRVMTIGSSEGEFTEGISEVALSNKFIYIFTKAGEIIKFTPKLKAVARAKFKFAHFSVATVSQGRVYALDQRGSLIVLSSDLKKHRIYDVGEVSDFAFVSGNRIYKDNTIISLDKLGL